MRAQEIMTAPVHTVDADTTVHQAAEQLATHQLTSMPVVDGAGKLVGMVSELDLLRGRFPPDPRSHMRPSAQASPDPARLVGQVMSRAVVSATPTTDTADLALLMLTHDVRAMPVVDDDRMVGIVSRRDLLRTLLRADADIAADVRAVVGDQAGGGFTVEVVDGVVHLGGGTDAGQPRAAAALAGTVPGVVRVHSR